MKILLLMSSLRSGSHMVRSMLRADAGIVDLGGEHRSLTATDVPLLGRGAKTSLVPLKYGFKAPTLDCIDLADAPKTCALILTRRDTAAQARSLAHALVNGSWLGPTGRTGPVSVSAAESDRMAERNASDLAKIRAALTIPHAVLAYEDITPATLATALGPILGRDVTVVDPATVKISER